MSRYVLQSKNPKLECVVGWDAPLQTFFGQVIDPKLEEEAQYLEWWGASWQEISEARELVPLMERYAEISEEVLRQLEKEQAGESRSADINLLKLLPLIRGKRILFPMGELRTTIGAVKAIEESGTTELEYTVRHVSGDWGDMPKADKAANDQALKDGTRIFSGYLLPKTQVKIWIITEADRSATTILLPSEY